MHRSVVLVFLLCDIFLQLFKYQHLLSLVGISKSFEPLGHFNDQSKVWKLAKEGTLWLVTFTNPLYLEPVRSKLWIYRSCRYELNIPFTHLTNFGPFPEIFSQKDWKFVPKRRVEGTRKQSAKPRKKGTKYSDIGCRRRTGGFVWGKPVYIWCKNPLFSLQNNSLGYHDFITMLWFVSNLIYLSKDKIPKIGSKLLFS